MARNFDLASGPNYSVNSVGSCGAVGNGAYTIIALFNINSGNNSTGLISFRATGINAELFIDTNQIFGANDFGGGQTGVTVSTWWWAGIRKAAGTATYRYSLRQYNTGSTTHQDSVATHADSGVTNTSIRLGDSDDRGNGLIAVLAAWTSNLSDGAVAGMFTTAATDVTAQSPQGLWLGNQASSSDPINDASGNGADQTSVNGAIGVGSDPPSYNYSLSGAPVVDPTWAPHLLVPPGRISPAGFWTPWRGDPSVGGVILVALGDAGSEAEALTVSATVALADSASAADTLTVAVSVGLADSAAGADSLTVSASAPLADSGTGADSLAVTATAPLADSASATDALAATTTVPLADSGSSSEALTATATVPLADAGSAADALDNGTGTSKTLTDTASAVDALTVTVAVALADVASEAEALTIAAAAALNDAASAVQAIAEAVTLGLTDAGSAIDAGTGSSGAQKALSDTGSGTERIHARVVRPNTGTTSRQSSGTTTRPYTGITLWP